MELDLLSVEKPARYMGAEMGIVVKPEAELRIALAFPDLYEVGMSHLGLRILYHILNAREGIAAERVFAPWPDMAAQLASRHKPLATLETDTPLFATDMIGFTLQYELSCTNIIKMLDQSGIPRRAALRDERWPLILGGGPGAYNPEPLAPFFDAFLLGDGEEAVLEIAEILRCWKKSADRNKEELLHQLTTVKGVYVPSFFEVRHHPDGGVAAITPLKEGYERVHRRFLPDLESASFPDSPVVPFLKTVHDRVALEIARGCTRGCRFCQAGMVWRPVRERTPDRVTQLAEELVAKTGQDEISLLALSAGDYGAIAPLLATLVNRYYARRIALALPSLRVETLTRELIAHIKRVRKTSFTLAPEAGTQRLRNVINKGHEEADLLATAAMVFEAGWRALKLYFMIGLPEEKESDVQGIVDLVYRLMEHTKKGGQITVSVSTFVPKAHTPFQWQRQVGSEETWEKQELLKRALRHRRIELRWHDHRMSLLEGLFSRGDDRLGRLVETAYELGCRFDGWADRFRFDLWERAMELVAIDVEKELTSRSHTATLPWDFIDCGLRKEFLLTEWKRAQAGILTPDCRLAGCTDCGVCDALSVTTVEATGEQIPISPPTPETDDQNPQVWRYRLLFTKCGIVRFLSHREVATLLQRALSRGNVPLHFSSGFHPHPRFSFATATSVGVESYAEYMDLFVDGMEPEICRKRLNRVLPEGIQVLAAWPAEMKAASLSTLIEATRYRIVLPDADPEQLQKQCVQFMAQSSFVLIREKKGERQSIDLRQETRALDAVGSALEMVIVRGKPYELAAAITGLPMEALKKLPVEKLDVLFSA